MQKFIKSLKRKTAAVVAVGTVALTTAPAFASGGGGVDVGTTVSAIAAAVGPIGQIGAAILGVHVAIKVYKWVRQAM